MKFFSLTTGMKFHNGNEVMICPGKVVSVDLLTDRKCVSKSAVILEFPYLLLTAWVDFLVSGIVRSRKVVNNIYILMRARKTNAPQRWHQVLLADVG